MEASSPEPNTMSRDVAAAAADLLDQGAIIDRLSRPITIAALIGLMIGLGLGLGPLLIASLLLVTLAGLAETYLAMRTGFEAALFRRVAAGEQGCERDTLAEALVALGLNTASNTAQRALGARKLLVLQGATLVLQIVIILFATALAHAQAG
jgi:hypothetical protein